MADPVQARHVFVQGRVQGVGYRFSMVAEAQRRGLSGWVRNRRDGRVEAVVSGDGAAVASLLAWCSAGPPGANVTELAVELAAPLQQADGFHQRTTV